MTLRSRLLAQGVLGHCEEYRAVQPSGIQTVQVASFGRDVVDAKGAEQLVTAGGLRSLESWWGKGLECIADIPLGVDFICRVMSMSLAVAGPNEKPPEPGE